MPVTRFNAPRQGSSRYSTLTASSIIAPPSRLAPIHGEGDAMPNITIQWFAGRTQDQKRQLTAAITDAMVKIGKTTPDQVHIVFQDVEKSNWGWNGKLASD